MKIKNLMTLLSGVTGSKSFFGLSVLMFVAFMSFSTTVNAQYVSTPVAIQVLRQDSLLLVQKSRLLVRLRIMLKVLDLTMLKNY